MKSLSRVWRMPSTCAMAKSTPTRFCEPCPVGTPCACSTSSRTLTRCRASCLPPGRLARRRRPPIFGTSRSAVFDVRPLDGVVIRGMAASLPRNRQTTAGCPAFSNESEASRFATATGIRERRIAVAGQCASDLCGFSADALIEGLGWERSSIGMLVLVTQSGDFVVPATSILLQHRLGLSTRCMAYDINLGCSAFPYGMAQVASVMRALGVARGLLLIGDVSSRGCHPMDASSYPLFGDAGSAIALELDPDAAPMYFDLNSDGAGGAAICVRGSGPAGRYPVDIDSLLSRAPTAGGENVGSELNTRLRGADIFSFSISEAPKCILRVLEKSGSTPADVDHLLLHQANRMINETVRRKSGFATGQTPGSLELYGNTGSASIPVTLCVNADQVRRPGRVLACGFGVGLSWGSVLFSLDAGVPLLLVETDEVFRPDLVMDPDNEE
ncbi:MAG: ketoacyl-ACP synthase III [Rhodocyclaceae bacterium]|nr:ketoacyl-ACP synthase III [Rhodocyclaceae bacterium]